MGRVQLCVVASLGLAVPALAYVPMPSVEPVRLFTDVCTEGQGRLAKSAVKDSSYVRMPAKARAALDYAAPSKATLFAPLRRSDVPNRILMVDDDLFLMLPAADQQGLMAPSCAVVWKGTDFERSRDAILDIAHVSPSVGDRSTIVDVHDYGVRSPHYSLRAVEMDGWTILLETPYAGSSASEPTSYSRSVATTPGMLSRDKGNGETIVTTNHQ